MIRIGHVDVVDPGEQEADVDGAVGRAGKAVQDPVSHGVPGQSQPLNHLGGVAVDRQGGGRRRKGIGFADDEVGRPHRLDDLVCDPIFTDIAEGGGEAAGDRPAPTGEQAA